MIYSMATKEEEKPKQILRGRSVSRGFGIGNALWVEGDRRQFYKMHIASKDVENELKRFRQSIEIASEELSHISVSINGKVGKEPASIFESHLLFLQDRSFIKKIEDAISTEKINAEWAVRNVTDTYVARYKLLTDRHLREKYIDLEDVCVRIIRALGGEPLEHEFADNTILVAREVYPSTVVSMSRVLLAGIVTEEGGWTSHTSILARELGIPAVTGLRGVIRQIETDDFLAVDGNSGVVILNPSTDLVAQNRQVASKQDELKPIEDLQTVDGFGVTLRANIDRFGSIEDAIGKGAKGIGLYRSEALFDQRFPSEEVQYKVYSKAAQDAGKEGIRIRTFDLNFDRVNIVSQSENNPALGVRGIRFSLFEETEFRTQLRAILRATQENQVDVIFPMISDASEIRSAKEICLEEKRNLESVGLRIEEIRFGAMIEVPSAVVLIEEILEEVDFLSIGTNDLVQYILGVDRDNERLADWFQTLHPAVLRSIAIVLEAGNKAQKPVIVCGEMAGSPVYSTILLGLGAKELSMNVNSLPRVANAIRQISFANAQELANLALKAGTVNVVKEDVRNWVAEHWSNVFAEDDLP